MRQRTRTGTPVIHFGRPIYYSYAQVTVKYCLLNSNVRDCLLCKNNTELTRQRNKQTMRIAIAGEQSLPMNTENKNKSSILTASIFLRIKVLDTWTTETAIWTRNSSLTRRGRGRCSRWIRWWGGRYKWESMKASYGWHQREEYWQCGHQTDLRVAEQTGRALGWNVCQRN